MNILVTGATLANKGAESMLYIVMDEMKKRFPEAVIYFATDKDYEESRYKCKKFYMSGCGLNIATGSPRAAASFAKEVYKDVRTGHGIDFSHFFGVKKHFKEMDMMIDISGFKLGKQWPKAAHRNYLSRIALAKRYNIPVYLMPQSFGPFDYDAGMQEIKSRMADLLRYPKLIFAREREGYDDLKSTFHLNNVILSTDLVLQNTGIDWRNVFTEKPVMDIPRIVEEKTAGIVPNKQCFKHGDKNWNLRIYTSILNTLLEDGYRIVIFRHSREDLEIARMIKELYRDDHRVQLEEKEFSCLEYDEYVKQFRFIVCSRFHGIVHAYRNGIPAIALGWAVKYRALTECVHQEKYAFDITEGKCNPDEIAAAVRDMESNYTENKKIIKECVRTIQKENCFDQIQIGLKV